MALITGVVVLLLLSGHALADSPDDAVVVTALRNPVAKSYRRMVEGAELFEEKRHLAPAAELRFKLIPRKGEVSMEGIRLKVEAESLAIPLKVAPDRTFALQLDRTALEEDGRVIPDRKDGTMTWRADVRTPGLPPDTRRLGDLRLECEVGMKAGLVSNYPRGFFGWLDELITRNPGYCRRAAPRYLFFAGRPLFSVALVDGSRREVLPVDRLYGGATRDPQWKEDRYCDCEALFDRAYFVPLGDPSWPDDTRVELEYMDGAHAAEDDLGIGESTKTRVQAALGEAVVVDFASGYEVWVYREPAPEKEPAEAAELVLLFAPSGILARSRVR